MKRINFEETKNEIAKTDSIGFNRSFDLAIRCAKLLRTKNEEKYARDLAIRILDAWEKVDSKTFGIWNHIIESLGLYPYLKAKDLEGSSLIRHEFHRSKYLKDIYFHEEQMDLSLRMAASKSIIVSAPTSFGKSLLIEEIVASKRYKNIVIIQPTLALLDETRKKLKKYQDFYRIIISTEQLPSKKANLFLLTAERVVEYQYLPNIDFFVIDEFYKLSMERDDERAAMLNYAFYKLLKMTKTFYLLGPNINYIPAGFEKDYSAKFIKSDYSTVAVDIYEIKDIVKKKDQEAALNKLLESLDGQTLVYCSAPGKANRLMTKFVEYSEKSKKLSKINNIQKVRDLVEWISKHVNRDWVLNKALIFGIGMHHGALPRHIGSSIVDYFNQARIKYLFCTSTLIEGVNTSAKNVVLFDKKKGPKLIDYFDFRNIVGRTGRMKEHFIGRVYQFHPEPPIKEIQVDFPFYTQEKINSELMVQLDSKDVRDKRGTVYKIIKDLSPEVRELVKNNKGIPVEGQMAIIEEITNNVDYYHPLMYWSNHFDYPKIYTVLNLAWQHLRKKGESLGGVFSAKQLAFMALKYTRARTLAAFINMLLEDKYTKEQYSDTQERTQKTIDNALQITRHWFEYKLPKYLQTMSQLQAFVFKKFNKNPGDYSLLASQIENRFLPSNLSILLEYGIPDSAIRKLKKYIRPSVPPEKVIDILKKTNLNQLNLLQYEVDKIESIL